MTEPEFINVLNNILLLNEPDTLATFIYIQKDKWYNVFKSMGLI